ncbi:hypothetical protein B0H14DRAFT_3453773 [Mycena olivaceomarginata]|nr:hypothetical protein B0H14DRAFT_3453773 [Mycena olivaceomarginata]
MGMAGINTCTYSQISIDFDTLVLWQVHKDRRPPARHRPLQKKFCDLASGTCTYGGTAKTADKIPEPLDNFSGSCLENNTLPPPALTAYMQKVSEIALEHPKNLWANGDDGDNNNDDIPPLVSDDWSGKSLLSVSMYYFKFLSPSTTMCPALTAHLHVDLQRGERLPWGHFFGESVERIWWSAACPVRAKL